MNKSILILLFVVTVSVCASAQQRAQFTQYMNNNYLLNPAVGGTEDYIDIKAGYRHQWMGMTGAPTTYYLTAHTPLGKFRGKPHPIRDKYKSFHQVGGMVYNDVTGPTSRAGLSLSYGYNMAINRNLRISMAASLGVQQYTLDGNMLEFHDTREAYGVQRSMVPDASVGTWIYNTHFYVGLSTSQIFQSRLDFTVPAESSLSGLQKTGTSKLNNHYYLTGGYRIPLTPDFALIPSALVKFVSPAPVSVDINAKVKYQDLLWAGASYRNMESIALLAGVTIKNFVDIGYSYDAGVNKLRNFNSGSHEIIVGVRLRPKGDVICPSNFW